MWPQRTKVLVAWSLIKTYKTPFSFEGPSLRTPNKVQTPFRGIFHVSFTLFLFEMQYEVHCHQIFSWPRSRSIFLLCSLQMTSFADKITRPFNVIIRSSLWPTYGLFWRSAGISSCAKARAHPSTFQGPAWNIKTHSWLAAYQRCGRDGEAIFFLTDWRIFVRGLQG